MKQKLFTIYDVKAEAYLRPFTAPTKGLALRSFIDAANDPREPMNKHAADYTLFEIGEWDEIAGTIKMYDAKLPLGTALEHITNNQHNNDGHRS